MTEEDKAHRKLKSFDIAQEVTKQLIALSTGIVAITISFQKDLLPGQTLSVAARIVISLSWVCFLVSIVLGVMCLMAITRVLHEASEEGVYDEDVKFCSTYQIYLFWAAVLLSVVYGVIFLFLR